MRARVGLGLGVIAALAIAIWAAVSQGGDEPPPTTTTSTLTTSSTESRPSSTSTTVSTTTSTTEALPTTAAETTGDPQDRTEEARQILRDLYYRWFDAIYRKDENAVLEISATSNNLDDFRRAISSVEFPRGPERSDIVIRDLEILRWDDSCLVVYAALDLSSWRGEGRVSTVVNVLLPVDGQWLFGTTWLYKDDLWQDDCRIEPDLH